MIVRRQEAGREGEWGAKASKHEESVNGLHIRHVASRQQCSGNMPCLQDLLFHLGE